MSPKKLEIPAHILRMAVCGILLILSGCSSPPAFETDWLNQFLYTPTPIPVILQTATPSPGPLPTPSTTAQPQPAVAQPQILRIWLPPQFNPNANNPAAALLKERLNDFEADHPGLEIDVRVKSESGEADLLNSLSITSMAAQGALPDLIALPRHSIEAASQKGLIKPVEAAGDLQEPEWHPYARELAEIDGIPYGIPFAGDALVTVYRPDLVWIKSWDDVLLSEGQLVFAGADPQAETALALYVSAGGELADAQGNPTLDQDTLVGVLELFARGRGATLFPEAAKNISDDDQVLQEYRNRRTDMAILHFSKYRSSQDGLYQPLMSLGEDTHFTFADGWMWVLTDQPPEQQQLARELAEYLTADEFLAPWIQEAGYLPTRRFETNGQPDEEIEAVVRAAHAIPAADTIAVVGPVMQEAVVRVLNGEDPEAVARSVIEKLR